MSMTLIIDSAATGAASISRKLTDAYAAAVQDAEPRARFARRDVGAGDIPHLTAATTSALRTGHADTDAGRAAIALSDTLLDELRAADTIVIGAPMYNFGIPSTLKAWFDHVLRAGLTFRYTEAGPEGLMTGKRALVIEARGGLYSEGPAAAMDSQESHLRTLLGFMGVTDVTFVRAERLGFGPEAQAAAIADALAAIDTYAKDRLPLAA